jgi:predicted nucleotidyltransferase
MDAVVTSERDAGLLGQQLRAALGARIDVRFALIFGSRARGTENQDSDVDVAVLAPGVDIARLAAALSHACGEEVDVISLGEEVSIPLLDELLRVGELLFVAVPGVSAAWRSHALSTLELDRPWYRRMRDAWLSRVAQKGL